MPYRAPDVEARRLVALDACQILDTPPEPAFDGLARLAALCADVPTGLLNIVAGDRMFFKARHQADGPEPDLEGSTCLTVVRSAAPLVVENLEADDRFRRHAFVEGGARFYAGFPIIDSEGHALGTICAAGPVPKTLTPAQIDMMAGLARQAAALIETRKRDLRLGRAEAALADEEKSHQMLVEQLAEGVIIADFETGRVSQANCAARKLLGVSIAGVQRLTLKQVFAPGETPTGPELVAAVRAGRAEAGRRRLCHADGSLIDVEMSIGFVPSAGKTTISLVVRDVSEQMAYEQRLRDYQAELETANVRLLKMATTDGLTQIHNRSAFNDRFLEEIRRSARSRRPLALILFDVDYFKKYNDAFGHPEGDEVLRSVARIFRDSVRATDFVARYGGEEFAAILPETSLEGAEVVADRVRAAIEEYDWPLRPITISVGVAATPADRAERRGAVARRRRRPVRVEAGRPEPRHDGPRPRRGGGGRVGKGRRLSRGEE